MNGRILIVEDNAAMIASLRLALGQKFTKIEIYDSPFDEAPNRVKEILPDIMILDLFLDNVGDENEAAKPTWDLVLKDHFCPVVIHSAHDVVAYSGYEHPYIRYERKNATSIGKVMAHIGGFGSQVMHFRGLRLDLTKRVGEALRETSRLLAKKKSLTDAQEKIVLRTARRRVAASFDDVDKHEYGWERYVFPPLGGDLLMGDILIRNRKPADKPESYRIVLTPSCDLVPGRSGTADEVLVAGCRPFAEFQNAAQLKGAKAETLREKMPSILSRDQIGGLVPLPGLPGVFPTMCIDLRELSFVPLAKIKLKGKGGAFARVASMDSPFREKLMWAFVQIAGRPATPDFDATNWINEIIAEIGPVPAVAEVAKGKPNGTK